MLDERVSAFDNAASTKILEPKIYFCINNSIKSVLLFYHTIVAIKLANYSNVQGKTCYSAYQFIVHTAPVLQQRNFH